MRQPGTPLRHAGGNYLLVEGGYNRDTRSVTLLAAPSNEAFTHGEKARHVVWRDQGEWYVIAQWAVGMLSFQDEAYEAQRPLVEEVVERFLEERADDPEIAWAVQGMGGFLGSLEEILPMGLAAKVFSTEEAAAEVAGTDEVVPITNLAQFLTQLARDGYAGAMWDERQPIFFCIDGLGEVQFLRVRKDASQRMQLELLAETGDWVDYDGAEEIEFLENRESCDERLVSALGSQPVMGWPLDGKLWAVGPRTGEPGQVTSDEDDVVYGVLFSKEELAREWNQEVEPSWIAFLVDDLPGFLSHDALAGHGGLLNPGSHRVQSGVLWRDGERVVLDSFSGFWAFESGRFQALD